MTEQTSAAREEPIEPAESVNDTVRAVAALLPFDVELDADMGYTGALVIDLGRRGGVDDPPDTASIDTAIEPAVWMFDVEGGAETIASDLDLTADPADVARWISEQAHRAGSPAASSPASRYLES